MILAIGTDLVDKARIDRACRRFGTRFEARLLGPAERSELPAPGGTPDRRHAAVARRFSQKEAVVKALGTGIGAGVGWHDVEIRHHAGGAPYVRLHGAAAERLRHLGGRRVLLSTSDERAYAVSFALIDGAPEPPAA
jgi:holo-[acyl-carrier protein] synthase